MADQKTNQRVHIWEDPESKINFLETTMVGKKWQAAIHPSTMNGGEGNLPTIQRTLNDKGYLTKIDSDEKGQQVLLVTKLGSETIFLDAISKLGLVQGIRHTYHNIGSAFSKVIDKARKTANFWTENKAKRIGLIYLMGDIIMTFTGLDEGPNKTAQVLRSSYGLMGAAQSLIFMNFAAEADQQLSKELDRKFNAANQDGLALSTSLDWLQKDDPRSKSHTFMEKNAINVGSLTQIAGRLLWMTAGKIEIDYGKNDLSSARTEDAKSDAQALIDSGKDRIKDSLFSISGWLLIMLKSDKADKEKPATNPLNFIKKYSNPIAGTANAMSTFFGIRGDLRKLRKFGTNQINLAGNLAYLAGDVVVAITDSSDYDEKSATSPAMLGRVAARFMQSMPVIIGHEQKLEMAQQIADYLASRAVDIENSGKHEIGKKEISTTELSQDIYNSLLTELPEHDLGLQAVTAKVADIVMLFPEEKRMELAASFAQTLSTIPSILADTPRIFHSIQSSLSQKKASHSSKLVQMKDLQTPLANLVAGIPSTPNQAETAIALYDAVQPYLMRNRGEVDTNQFSANMEKHFTKPDHPRVNQSAANLIPTMQ